MYVFFSSIYIEHELEKLLERFVSSRIDLEGRSLAIGHKMLGFNQVYSIDCHLNISKMIRKINVRGFFPHDFVCKFEGSQKISSTTCCFLGWVLSDHSLLTANAHCIGANCCLESSGNALNMFGAVFISAH